MNQEKRKHWLILSLFRYTQIFIETNYNTLVVELYFYRNLEGLKMGSELPWSMYPICLFDNDNVMGLLLSITYCKVFSYLKYGDLFTKFNCVVICALSLRVWLYVHLVCFAKACNMPLEQECFHVNTCYSLLRHIILC